MISCKCYIFLPLITPHTPHSFEFAYLWKLSQKMGQRKDHAQDHLSTSARRFSWDLETSFNPPDSFMPNLVPLADFMASSKEFTTNLSGCASPNLVPCMRPWLRGMDLIRQGITRYSFLTSCLEILKRFSDGSSVHSRNFHYDGSDFYTPDDSASNFWGSMNPPIANAQMVPVLGMKGTWD